MANEGGPAVLKVVLVVLVGDHEAAHAPDADGITEAVLDLRASLLQPFENARRRPTASPGSSSYIRSISRPFAGSAVCRAPGRLLVSKCAPARLNAAAVIDHARRIRKRGRFAQDSRRLI